MQGQNGSTVSGVLMCDCKAEINFVVLNIFADEPKYACPSCKAVWRLFWGGVNAERVSA